MKYGFEPVNYGAITISAWQINYTSVIKVTSANIATWKFINDENIAT